MLSVTTFLLLTAPMATQNLFDQVDPARMRRDVEMLAKFNTRNTLSPQLIESATWLRDQYRSIPGVKAELMTYVLPKGRRVTEDKQVVQVVAWLDSSDTPANTLEELKGKRVVAIGGHLDSLNLEVNPETGRAPGANDDASGTILALECARAMSRRKWDNVIVFVGFTGEEQGLHGSRALAKFAKANDWKLEAVLSNDTVGSSSNLAGQKNTKQVRIFSDEATTHNSRELARFCAWSVAQDLKEFSIKLVTRADRFGRGGDHTPFAQEGFSAVRYIEVHEEYTRQHTPNDLPEYMDWAYLANVTKANLAPLSRLANAGPAPSQVRVVRDQSHDTTVSFMGAPGQTYRLYWRTTTSAVWEGSTTVKAQNAEPDTIEVKHMFAKINKDDHVFAVGAEGGVPIEAR